MRPNAPLLPEALRRRHAENASLGCGNFLHIACEVSPHADQTHLVMDEPFRLFTGEVYPSFSLTELRHAVDTLASWYYGAGVRAKDPVGVYVSEGVGNLVHYLAINAIGAIPAIVNGNVPAEIAAKWLEKVGATGLYTDAAHLPLVAPHARGNTALRYFVTDETAAKAYRPELPPVYPFRHVPNDTVLIGHSSGTTGIPKAVAFQHQQFFHGIRYRLGLPFPAGSERVLSALPHSHSAGIAYVTLALLNGCTTMVLSSNRPETVLPAIESFAPSMVVAFPETYVLLAESDVDAHDLSSIQLWFNGGDAAHETHIRRLITKGHHFVEGQRRDGSIFIDGLGSSEMGFSLFRNVHTPTTKHYDRCIGKPLDWVDAAVLNDQGERLPPYRVGKLGVKSPTITPGYWNDSVLTARSQLGGYFLTGDLFYCDEQGRFFHVDRVPDAVRTKAGMVYSLETEELLMKHHPEIADCTVVAAPAENGDSEEGHLKGANVAPSDPLQQAVAVVRLHKEGADGATLLARFNETLKGAARNPLGTVVFGDASEFPTGPTGKILKRELRERFRERFQASAPRRPRAALEPLHG